MTTFPIPITAIFTGILALMLVGISARVSLLRQGKKISLADGGDGELRAAVRVQGNFIEYVPMALVLMGLIEAMGTRHWVVYAFGALLVVARVAHAWGLYGRAFPARVFGTSVTWGLLAAGGLMVIGLAA
jgi:uncharacterized membrane protein YecN with MAPEG domain